MNLSFAAFSSPLGACHFAPPSVSSSLLLLPFLRTSPKVKSPKSKTLESKKVSPTLSIRTENSVAASTYTRSTFADALPPTYREAVGAEEDLGVDRGSYSYSLDENPLMGVVEQQLQSWHEERKAADRQRVARQDREMEQGLASMGL